MSVGTQKSGLFKAVERESASAGTVISIDACAWRNVEGVKGIRERGILFLIRHQVRRLLNTANAGNVFVTTIGSKGGLIKYTFSSFALDCYVGDEADETIIRWQSIDTSENDNHRSITEVCIELLPGRNIRCTKGAAYLPSIRKFLQSLLA